MADSLNSPLPHFLVRTAPLPFSVGGCDCVLWCCDWVLSQRGVDPASPWRGRYRTAAGAHRLIRRAGSLADLVADGMARAGIPETSDPLPGDVAVISTAIGDLMGIRSPLGWAVKTQTGVAATTGAVIRGWSI